MSVETVKQILKIIRQTGRFYGVQKYETILYDFYGAA